MGKIERPAHADLVAIMAAGDVRCVYQPIVALESGEVAGYEALARGPDGWARTEDLLDAARLAGRLPELDWICRAAACRGALDAGLPHRIPLFVNIEPSTSRVAAPAGLRDVFDRAAARLQVVVEITERSVAADPAGLLGAVDRVRRAGLRVALDDVGADAASQAMMPLVRPDVIKLDRTIVEHPTSPAARSVIAAVRAEAQRTGALVLAEGIETPERLAVARSIGATLGQGWLLGRPAPLPAAMPGGRFALPRAAARPVEAATPFEVARRRAPVRPADRRTLIAVSRRLEDRGVHATEPTVLLTTFQHARYFDAATRRRYAEIAADGMLTAVYGEGMPPRPAPAVRGCRLRPDDPLVGEWTVVVIGSGFAGGLFARQRAGGATFDFVTSADRDLVLAAAVPLIHRLLPT